MPNYNYTAVNSEGKIQKGIIEAESKNRLRDNLEKDNFELVNCSLKNGFGTRRNMRLKMKTADLANLLFQLGVQLRSGVSIVDALRSRDGEEGDTSSAQSTVRQRLAELVEQGTPMSEGLNQFPRIFPGYVRNVVRVAERSGTLPENLISLRGYMEWLDQNWKTFKQAMLYPAFVMLALIAFIFIALRFIFPTVVELLYELEIPLPIITKIMISLSDFVVAYWIWILVLAFLIPTGLRTLFIISQTAAYWRDKFLINLPYLGSVIHTLAIARFIRSLILMQRAGIVITDSLRMAREVVGNRVVEAGVIRIESAVANGSTISSTIAHDSTFPALVRTMIGVGERSGSLDESLEAVLYYYDDLIPRKIKTFFAVLEPVLIVVTVLMAGFVAAAVFLPLVQMLSPGSFN